MKKKIVLAGSYPQFNRFLEENGGIYSEYVSDYVYASDRHRLAGIVASEVIIYGSFWDRDDAAELYEFAQTRIMPT